MLLVLLGDRRTLALLRRGPNGKNILHRGHESGRARAAGLWVVHQRTRFPKFKVPTLQSSNRDASKLGEYACAEDKIGGHKFLSFEEDDDEI